MGVNYSILEAGLFQMSSGHREQADVQFCYEMASWFMQAARMAVALSGVPAIQYFIGVYE